MFPDTVALVAVSSIGELFSSISPKLMATNSKWKKTVLNSFFQAINTKTIIYCHY